jgi:septal ring factor EnvC (AmiA/AmiB activator)
LLAVALALCAGGPTRAADTNADQPSAAKLQELENAIEKGKAEREQASAHAAKIAQEQEQLRADLVAAASAAQEHEETLSDLEGRMFELDGDVAAKEAALEHTRQQTSGVIAALARLAANPTAALIGEPAPPADTVRTAILLRAALPNLDQAARRLRDDLEALAKARQAVAGQKTKIAGTVERLDADHKYLAALYAKRAAAREQADTATKETEARLASLAGEAADMRDLLAKLDAEQQRLREEKEAMARQAEAAALVQAERDKRAQDENRARADAARAMPPPPKLFSQAQGRMPLPARGAIAIHFGQANEAGLPAKGISIATRSGAEVVAPFDGEVAFAGPFRGYGLLLIIEHGEGYHTLLAGMARIDCQVGQHLVAGEPVGVMLDSEEKPLLYVELRRQGQPINPLPWFVARKSKVSE